jgi:hypothetical protein
MVIDTGACCETDVEILARLLVEARPLPDGPWSTGGLAFDRRLTMREVRVLEAAYSHRSAPCSAILA